MPGDGTAISAGARSTGSARAGAGGRLRREGVLELLSISEVTRDLAAVEVVAGVDADVA